MTRTIRLLIFFSTIFFINPIIPMGDYEHIRRISSGEPTNATSLAISPKGDLIGIGGKASGKALVKWWDMESGELVGTVNTSRLGYTNYANSVAFNHDSTLIAARGCKNIGLWNTKTGEWFQKIGMEHDGSCIAFSPEDQLFTSNFLQLETCERNELGKFVKKGSENSWIHGRILVGKAYLMKHRVKEGGLQVNERAQLGKHGSVIRMMPKVTLYDMSPNEKYMVSLEGEARISIHKIEKDGECVQQLRCPYSDKDFFAGQGGKDISSLALSRDETEVAAVRASTIYLWRNWRSRDSLQEIPMEGSEVREIAFGSDGTLVALSKDGSIDMWGEKK
mgnify:CR=1 FL=1